MAKLFHCIAAPPPPPPSPPFSRRGGGGKENNFSSLFRLRFCVCVCGYPMALNTNEKKVPFCIYLLTFIDKIISCNGYQARSQPVFSGKPEGPFCLFFTFIFRNERNWMKKSARVSEKLVSPGLPGLQVATRLVILHVVCQTPKIDNLWCSLKNNSYQWAVTKHVILTQGHVTYNITKVLFGFYLIPPFWKVFRIMFISHVFWQLSAQIN